MFVHEFTLRERVNIKWQVVNGTINAPAGYLHHVGGPEVEEEAGTRIRPPISGHHWVQHHLHIKRKSRLLRTLKVSQPHFHLFGGIYDSRWYSFNQYLIKNKWDILVSLSENRGFVVSLLTYWLMPQKQWGKLE